MTKKSVLYLGMHVKMREEKLVLPIGEPNGEKSHPGRYSDALITGVKDREKKKKKKNWKFVYTIENPTPSG